jgi:hypothetical protein
VFIATSLASRPLPSTSEQIYVVLRAGIGQQPISVV